MRSFLFQLLGLDPAAAGEVVGWQWQFQPVWNAAVSWVLVGLAAVVAVASYRVGANLVTPGRRRWLMGLRLAALVGIALLVFRPSVGLQLEGTVRQSLVLLFDQSASMALRDPRLAAEDRVRAGIAEGTVSVQGGLSQRAPAERRLNPTRLELVQAALTNQELRLVDRLAKEFDLKVAGFSGDLTSLGGVAEPTTNSAGGAANLPRLEGAALAKALQAEGRESAPGAALRELLDRERGRPLGGVVMFTDGIRNAGPDPREVLSAARERGVPIHFVGAGTTAPRDLQVVEVVAQEVAFVRDEVAVTVRLRARGMTGEVATATLSLAGTTVDSREVTIEKDGEMTVPMKFTPELTGDFELAAAVPARSDEILAENNRHARRLRVVDDRIRVLFLEQSARWEFRYLQALLLRDRRVELKCVLFDGDPAIARAPGSPYLESFPGRREDLFGYDLVIFGDVDPKHFTPAQLELLGEFVSRSGGSFLMLAGRRFSPWSYRDSALDRLLPVEFDRSIKDAPASSVYDRPIRLALTAEGKASPLLRLSEDPAESVRRWESLSPLYWVAPVKRAKPAATVLAVEPREADRGGPLPVIAMQQYGVGQSMFIGTDNIWRWRRNEGEPFFVSFWGRVVQRLAVQHLLSGSRKTQMTLDRTTALRGERVGVTARVYNNAFEPVADPLVVAHVESESRGTNRVGTAGGVELLLRAVPDQPGVFRGEIVTGAPGRYRITVGDETAAVVDFTVEDRWVEAGETALQAQTLREWAEVAGGGFHREEDLHRLPEAVRGMAQRVKSRAVAEVWSSPLYFLGILGLLAVEWSLRKLWRLK